jgi:hypothetical protein
LQLAIRLIGSLLSWLTGAFRVIILADTAFDGMEFLKAMRKRAYAVIVDPTQATWGKNGCQDRERAVVDRRSLGHGSTGCPA